MTSHRLACSALAVVTVAARAAAQGTCDIETRRPMQLEVAMAAIARHDATSDHDERLKLTRQLVRGLTTNPERLKNEAGRNYLLGQVYVRWFKDAAPRIVLRATRAELGFAENPDGEFFLPAALDEVMGVVEREKPACADSTARYRNAVFLDVLNAAINFNNAKAYDSAIVYANYALQTNKRSPQVGTANQVLANASKATRANPGTFTALQLFAAAVVKANGQQFAEAAELYDRGLQLNPWYRDALFNAANVHLALHQPERMAPLVERLRTVDPMNPDVVRLAGAVWQERGTLAADPATKKLSQDSVIAYVNRAAQLPARVTVSQFTAGPDNSVTIAGAVENLAPVAASLTVRFELVDKDGKALAAASVVAEGLAPKLPREFTLQVVGAAAVAWRYSVP